MKHANSLRDFAQRHPRIGAYLWISSIQFYVAQLYVSTQFKGHFSLLRNTISDLGNSACGEYFGRAVCSPAHVVMSVSFVVLGITTTLGAIFLYLSQKKGGARSVYGFTCVIVAGIGTVFVGLFPENSPTGLHLFGARLLSVLGNLGIVMLGLLTPGLSRRWRYFTISLGTLGSIAVYLFVKDYTLGLGTGGMERVAAYPLSIWMLAYGVKKILAEHTQ